jgi:two-component system, NarL family, response regulator LiaR
MIKIVIVEDIPTHQEFLKSILKEEDGFSCIATIDNAKEAIFRIPDLAPDIVLIDLGLPDLDGVECIAQLVKLCPLTKFMVLTVYQDDNHIFEALKAGAKGYLLKRSKPQQIIEAIQDISSGGASISSEIAIKLLNLLPELKSHTTDASLGISKREKEILEYLAKGNTYDEIASQLFISINTLKSHVYRIYTKLNVDNRTEAINKYFRK